MLTPDAAAFIQSNAPFALDLLRVLARIPAPSCQEEKRVRFCQTLLESWGARSAFVDQAGNLVYPVGDQGDNPLVVFAAHADIVFPDTQSLPLREDDTRLFCPGVGDNTANLVALLLYLKYVLSRGLQPAGPGILFVVNTGEEGLGNLKGVRYLDGIYGSRMAEFYSFDGQMTGITDRAVGSRQYRVTVRTRGGHSLSGFGRPSAIAELAAMIGNIYALPVPAEGIATYNVGTIEGGLSVNAIAPEASMVCEYRADRRDMLSGSTRPFSRFFRPAGVPGSRSWWKRQATGRASIWACRPKPGGKTWCTGPLPPSGAAVPIWRSAPAPAPQTATSPWPGGFPPSASASTRAVGPTRGRNTSGRIPSCLATAPVLKRSSPTSGPVPDRGSLLF